MYNGQAVDFIFKCNIDCITIISDTKRYSLHNTDTDRVGQ